MAKLYTIPEIYPSTTTTTTTINSGFQGPQGPASGGSGSGFQGPQGHLGPQGFDATGTQGPQGPNSQGPQGEQGSGTQGSQGPISPQGFQGNQGVSGIQGNVGQTGAQGNVGQTGAPGVGLQGPVGQTGVQGSTGNTGAQGNQGNVGQTGAQGNVGQNGVQGVIGQTGAQGNQGNVGSVGLQGNQGNQGFMGVQGNQGPISPQGFQGYQGNQGLKGDIGFQGNQGFIGSTGSQGNQGNQGNTGATGSIGFQGNQGLIGVTGSQGNQGWQGVKGATGSQGNFGFQGSQGNQGWQGFQGNQGLIGVTGSQGNQGLKGDIGLQGNQGNVGSTGAQGNQGNIGATGSIGFQGNQGLKGDIGNTGLQGSVGSTGNTGAQGNQGNVGQTGAQGNVGSTGNTGVQGNQGLKGDIGNTGAQGNQGLIGVTGNTGAQGNVGSTGNQGNQGWQGFQGNQGLKGDIGNTGLQGNQGNVGSTGNTGAQGNQGVSGITTLTTSGNSGPSSYSSGTLNVPTYTLSGLGGQPIENQRLSTGNSVVFASVSAATLNGNIGVNDDDRSISWLPTTYGHQVRFTFVNSSPVGTGGNYAGVMTFSPYDGTSASTGDNSYQLAFGSSTQNGGYSQLRVRNGIDSTWNSWSDILTSDNYNSYSPTLTGGGASGTWGINISGNSATATTATTATTAGSTTLLSSLGQYIWSASTIPTSYPAGTQLSFVEASDGWQSYGTVITSRGYPSGGGGALQMYIPYSPTYGGNSLQVRFGNYDNSDNWTSWKILLASDNYNSYSPTLTGGGASGNWAINITGNSATTTLAANSTLWNGSTFDGSSLVSNYTYVLAYNGSAGKWMPASAGQTQTWLGLGSAAYLNATNSGGSGAGANQVVRYDANGYIQAYYINSDTPNNEGGAISQVITTNGSDNYYRKQSLSSFASAIGLGNYLPLSGGTLSGTLSGTTINAGQFNATPFSEPAITSVQNAPYWAGSVGAPSGAASFSPMIGQYTSVSGIGYAHYVSIGTWRSGGAGYTGAIYLAPGGGSDSYSTDYFLMSHGGNISYSGGSADVTGTLNTYGTSVSPSANSIVVRDGSGRVNTSDLVWFNSSHYLQDNGASGWYFSSNGGSNWGYLQNSAFIAASVSTSANTIVQRNGSGYIDNSYFYTDGGGAENNSSGLGYVAGFNGSDYYIRSYNSTAVASMLGLGSGAYNDKTQLWSVSHPTSYYISNTWDGTYWQLTSNHPNAVNVGHATQATEATYAHYLPTNYIGGVQANPQTYFNNGVGLCVAMTGAVTSWSDTLWINGYSGGDVPNMIAMHFFRNGAPRVWISSQSNQATSYGTMYEMLTEYNWNNYSPSLTGGGASGTWGINVSGSSNTSNYSSNAAYVDYKPSRTDNANYNVLWGSNQGTNPYTGSATTFAFSCDAVTINSSNGTLNASYFYTTGVFMTSLSGGIQISLNSVGSYYGAIANPSAQVWSLGYATATTTGFTNIFQWTPSSVTSNAYFVSAASGYATGGSGSAYTTCDWGVWSSRSGGPTLGFHYQGVVASTIGIEASGRIAIRNNPGTSYENLVANNIQGVGSVQGDRVIAGYDSGVSGSVNASNWFRVSGQTGIYNSSYAFGIYASGTQMMNMYNASGSSVGLKMSYNSESSTIGYLYGDASGFGLLTTSAGWGLRMTGGGDVQAMSSLSAPAVYSTGGFFAHSVNGMVGNYVSQANTEMIIWTIGDSWNTLSTHYGLGYNYGAYFSDHEITVVESGTTNISFGMGGSIWARNSITTAAFYQSSARSLKQNIIPSYINAIDKINSLSIQEYEYISIPGERRIGVIADDTDSLFLNQSKDAVNLQDTVMILVKAVQEQDKIIKDLKCQLGIV